MRRMESQSLARFEWNEQVPSRYFFLMLYALGASVVLNVIFGISVCSLLWWARPAQGRSVAAKQGKESTEAPATASIGVDTHFHDGLTSGFHHAGVSHH